MNRKDGRKEEAVSKEWIERKLSGKKLLLVKPPMTLVGLDENENHPHFLESHPEAERFVRFAF